MNPFSYERADGPQNAVSLAGASVLASTTAKPASAQQAHDRHACFNISYIL